MTWAEMAGAAGVGGDLVALRALNRATDIEDGRGHVPLVLANPNYRRIGISLQIGGRRR